MLGSDLHRKPLTGKLTHCPMLAAMPTSRLRVTEKSEIRLHEAAVF